MKKLHLYVLSAMLISGITFSVIQIILADPEAFQSHPASEIECDANLCIDSANNKIGIGSTSPTAKLQVSAPSSTEGLRIVSASNYSPLNIRNSANSADIFRIDQAGSLAVGSVPWARLSSFPSSAVCPSGQFVTAVGSTFTCNAVSGLPSGTANQTLRHNGSNWVANSAITNDGTNIGLGKVTSSATPFTLSAATAVLSFSSTTGNKTISTGGSTNLVLAPGGGVYIGASGTGKLTVGTVDPVYNIQGLKHATYMSGMLGVKEEATGLVQLNNGEYVIDFNDLEQSSDLWIFYRITDFGQNWSRLAVLLSAEGPGAAWYQKDPQNNKLHIYSQTAESVSFRFTAPRFDWQKWLNLSEEGEVSGLIVDEIVNDQYKQSGESFVLNTDKKDEGFVNILKEAIGSLGIIIENGILSAKRLVAEKITADTAEIKQFQMVDKITGQNYCIWLEHGEWVRVQGNCR